VNEELLVVGEERPQGEQYAECDAHECSMGVQHRTVLPGPILRFCSGIVDHHHGGPEAVVLCAVDLIGASLGELVGGGGS